MKLYNVPKGSFINYREEDVDIDVFFDHLDGAYSYCLTNTGHVIHLAAYSDVTPLKHKPEYWDEDTAT